ncbi:CBS-domain-containing protein [Setomelanomma holmii]|uniref:CBS-domain-containing protein n=1 Tax=Setomelanomma holmii TaxID=210430 RepID=A0A9P4LM29_9PLEO|nr:CBS-domain-containing protein [Setomelanomma holmii]
MSGVDTAATDPNRDPHIATFVSPRTLLEQSARPIVPRSALDKEQIEGLRTIRAFLKARTSYDVLPISYRLIVLDTALLVKKSLNILNQNGSIVSAPLWDSKSSTFAGLLTTSDYINVVQYYWQNPDALARVDQFRLNSLREIEKALGVKPIETISIHPDRPVYEACRKMLESRARRIPIVDSDDETHRTMVVSVITQYRILKFIAVNVKETQKLRKPLIELPNVGTYNDLATASMDTPVMDVIHMLVKKNISSVPIVDRKGVVLNVFEAVDVIALIKGGVYDDLNLTVGDALLKRSDDFPGIFTCSLSDNMSTIYDTIRRSRVHRFVVIDSESRLKGVLTLSDVLEHTLLEGLEDDE